MVVLGQLVHYVASGNKHRPAWVVDVGDGDNPTIYYCTLPEENGEGYRAQCPKDEVSFSEDTWHYPEI